MKRSIRGAGGGGKGGGRGGAARAPVESPDSLRSRQYARVLDAISEGEIVGLRDGLKSVYLDDTPVMNPNGSLNFQGVTLLTRTGTQTQPYVPGFGAVETEQAVSVEVKHEAPVVRSISNANANAVRITVAIPQLTYQDSTTGDISGTSVQIAIDVQIAGGGFVEQQVDTISGKTTSRYNRSYRVELPGSGPWDIRVRRLTGDSTQTNLQNATFWASYTEIIDAKLRYPNTALVALSVDAERFQSIPRRGYEIMGLKVKIPSNYDPYARQYSGAWDGTWTVDWTNNPAWCFYDMLTNPRYGLGEYVSEDQVDHWGLYQIARYCDELVPDGYGGMEPRYTCNAYIQSREDAYALLSSMASAFGGVTYWSGETVVATQDAPRDPVKLYTAANTVGGFNYSGSSLKTRHTVALVTWNDPRDRSRQKIEYVEDPEGIAKYGIVQTEVIAFGCMSRGQAHRFGKAILYSERMEGEVVSFRTGLDGMDIMPGDVIATSDPVRAGVRVAGRLKAATAEELTLDSAVTLEPGKTYTAWAVLPSGEVQTRSVTTGTGETDTLAVYPPFDDILQRQAMWALAANDLVPEQWRVISIKEADGILAEITAMSYRADKYAAIERDVILEPLETSYLDAGSRTPEDLKITESLYLINPAVVGARVTVSWSGDASYYEVQYRRKGNNWIVLTTQNPSIDIQPVDPGTYEFAVVAVNAAGIRSQPAFATIEVYGKYALPEDVEGFSVIKVQGVAVASWYQHPALDVQVGGEIFIRFSPRLEDVTWNDAYVLDSFQGGMVSGLLPLMTGTYFAKARDSTGNWSANAASFVATEGMVTGFWTVGITEQAPDFAGARDGTAVVSEGVLILDGSQTVDEMTAPVDEWPMIDNLGGVRGEGRYDFDEVFDLGTVATRRYEADILYTSYDTGDFIDSRTDNIDTWDSFEGNVINDCDITLYCQHTDDMETWSEPTPFFVADFTCRAMRLWVVLESANPTHNIAITRLTVRAKIPAE